jgi:hypothetical protein
MEEEYKKKTNWEKSFQNNVKPFFKHESLNPGKEPQTCKYCFRDIYSKKCNRICEKHWNFRAGFGKPCKFGDKCHQLHYPEIIHLVVDVSVNNDFVRVQILEDHNQNLLVSPVDKDAEANLRLASLMDQSIQRVNASLFLVSRSSVKNLPF